MWNLIYTIVNDGVLFYGFTVAVWYFFLALMSMVEMRAYLKRNYFIDYSYILSSPMAPGISLLAPAYNESMTSILGSLPYGDNGFMNYGNAMPHHQTLISLLKPMGYQSNFFYGGNPNFDNLDLFLEYQKTDRFINQTSFPTTIKQKAILSSWGLADRDVFRYAVSVLGNTTAPRLDLYLTLSTHEPFTCPDTLIASKANAQLQKLRTGEVKTFMMENRNIFQCLLYTDQAIRELIKAYSRRADFNETLFVITGDHRLIPMPSDNRLKRFHVPLMLYSPLVKQPVTFSAMGAHSSIAPTLLGWLSKSFNVNFPGEMPFLSDELSTDTTFGSSLQLAIARNKGVLSDYLDGTYYLSEDRLYEISDNLEITPVQNESKRNSLKTKLANFQARNRYACDSNRVDRGTSTVVLAGFHLTGTEKQYLKQIAIDSLNPDQQFEKARQLAFDKQYDQSRLIAKYILNKSPNFHDTRVLMARTFAWQQRFDSARLLLHQTLERSPSYPDAFVALADVEFWDGQWKKSLQVAEQGLVVNPNLDELKSRIYRAQEQLKKQ
jgi:tetratricopeptide (TPR) repeat protein